MLKIKKCPVCGTSFNRDSPKAIYCSKECKWKAFRIRSGRSKSTWSPDLVKNCKFCGRSFKPSKYQPWQKYCKRKQCVKERDRQKDIQWRKNNPKKARERTHRWKRRHPERAKEVMRRYDRSEKGRLRRERRADKSKEYQKKWVNENRDKVRAAMRRYQRSEKGREKNKQFKKTLKGRLANRKRALIKRSLAKKNYDHNRLIPILKKQNNKCPLCGSDYGKNYENMDSAHIYPTKKYQVLACDVNNIIPICRRCNRQMQDTFFIDFCNIKGYPIPQEVLKYIKKKKNQMKLKHYGHQ